MIITKFICECGNIDPRKAAYYDGGFGIEGVICSLCGRNYDRYRNPETGEIEQLTTRKQAIWQVSDELYTNFYRCTDCNVEWEDQWDCMCDDCCPDCGKEYTPYKSDQNETR